MSDWNEPGPGYSAFPAAVVFFAIVLVSCALVFRGHLFEMRQSARVYVPVASLEDQDAYGGCRWKTICTTTVLR